MSNTTDISLDLSYFMHDTTPTEATYPAPKRFVDKDGNRLQLIFRILSEEELREIRKHWRKRTIVKDDKTKAPIVLSNGTVAVDETYDGQSAMQEMLVESLIYPNLKDETLRKHYNCLNNIEMPLKVFPRTDDLTYVVKAFNILHGFEETDNSEEETESDIDKAKN